MSSYFENEQVYSSNNHFFKNQILKNYKHTIFQFIKITKKLSILKIFFLFLFLSEILISVYLIFNFSKSSIIAIALGVVVLSIFMYFVLLFYFQAKKNEQKHELCESFIASCRQVVAVPEGIAEHHLSVANALMKLSYYLYGIEYGYFPSLKKIKGMKNFCEKLSHFLHHEDVYKMQELLLFCAVEEHITQIKNTPTDLELHVSLANCYVSLSKLYLSGQKRTFSWSVSKKNSELLPKKFEVSSKRAIEEFNILKEFAPNDPWIHAQLAQCYHLLQMYEEEAKAHEIMLELSPKDEEIKYRLGRIYFQLGRNAEGLQIYEELKIGGFRKAEDLLSCYSATSCLSELEEIL